MKVESNKRVNYLLQTFLLSVLTLVFSLGHAQQNLTLRGRLTDKDNSPLKGATVATVNSKEMTLTNENGEFELRNVPANARLRITYTGFEELVVNVRGQASFNLVMQSKSKSMDDVVIIGYGSRRKSEVTGAITSVKASELTQTPIANLAQGMQGRVAGLQITQNNAAPGGSISVRLRGTNSINGSSEPLYIIDGIQIQNNTGQGVPGNQLAVNFGGVGGNANEQSPLSYINPDDIESIEVLKDASAAAIYGSQAANGVIIITTKRGKKGVSNISYDGYYGVQQISKKLSLLDAAEFAKTENEIFNQNRFSDPAALGEGTDWQDVIFRKAKIQNHQISFSGGNESTQYLMALNYFNQDGIVLSSKFDRFSVRLNLDHKVNTWLKVGTSTSISRSVNHRIQTGAINSDGGALSQSLIGAALAFPPVLRPTLDSQQYIDFYGELRNPISASFAQDITKVNTVLSNVYLDFSITQALKYRATLNAYSTNSLNDYYFPGAAFTPSERSSNGGLGGYGMKNNSNFLRLMHESILSYDKIIANDHTLRLTGVFSSLVNNSDYNYMTAQGFVNDATTNEAMHLARNFSINTNRANDKLFSYLARASYNFKRKYFVDVTGRADGSSKFGENNKFGFFPAVSFAWNMKGENFLQNLNSLSNLKLRLSHGVTGNQGAIGPYQSLATAAAGSDYAFNNVYTRGIAPIGVANPDLRWEKSTQSNIGLDADFFNNRLSFVADVYYKKTEDLIFNKALPLSSGYSTVTGNFAALENKGIELTLSGVPVRTNDFTWSLNANLTINRNKLLRLADDSTSEFAINNYNILRVGQPLGLFKTYVFDGIHQTGEPILPGQPVTNPRPGTHKVKDVSGPGGKPDGRISNDDRIITGNANPRFVYGFSTNVNYRQFDFSIFLSGVQGNQVFNLANYQLENPIGNRNMLRGVVNRWTPTNPNNEYQTTSGSMGGRLPLSDRYLEDGSFLRCKNLSLGYRLKGIKGLTNARLYLSANNLFTITDYTGFDPEVGTFGGSNTQIGVDNIVYPVSRSFLFGLQVTL